MATPEEIQTWLDQRAKALTRIARCTAYIRRAKASLPRQQEKANDTINFTARHREAYARNILEVQDTMELYDAEAKMARKQVAVLERRIQEAGGTLPPDETPAEAPAA